MKILASLFALIGLVSTSVAIGFYVGYTSYRPPCNSAISVFTKECKDVR